MSANFYHDEATMRGGDVHTYWTFVPGDPALTPVKAMTLYVTLAVHQPPVGDAAAIVAGVTSNGHKMVQGRCKIQYVLHIPIPLGPPHPFMEPVQYGAILLGSSSTPLLRRRSVTAMGHPLAVCIDGQSGLNVNCWEGIKLPSGYVCSESTVMTQPALEDGIDALADIVVDLITSAMVKQLPMPARLKNTVEAWAKKHIEQLATPLTNLLQNILKVILKEVLKVPVSHETKKLTAASLAPLRAPHVG